MGIQAVDPIRKALTGTVGCRVEIRSPDTVEARASAKRLQKTFDSCGYVTELNIVESGSRDGVFIEGSPESAGCALALQSAFHAAGIHSTVAILELSRREWVILSLGPKGIEAH
jgi:hypothetical protein